MLELEKRCQEEKGCYSSLLNINNTPHCFLFVCFYILSRLQVIMTYRQRNGASKLKETVFTCYGWEIRISVSYLLWAAITKYHNRLSTLGGKIFLPVLKAGIRVPVS